MNTNLRSRNNQRRKNQRRKNQKGAAMLEFALSFLLFFTVMYAIMEFGRFVYSYTILAGATREAARYAIVHGVSSGSPATQNDVRSALLRHAIGLNASALTVATTWNPGNTPGARVRIDATYVMTPFSGLIFRSPLTIGSRSEMVISQ
jgi:Flp pilus assembly protein TadG